MAAGLFFKPGQIWDYGIVFARRATLGPRPRDHDLRRHVELRYEGVLEFVTVVTTWRTGSTCFAGPSLKNPRSGPSSDPLDSVVIYC
jgi:hypothetical protein